MDENFDWEKAMGDEPIDEDDVTLDAATEAVTKIYQSFRKHGLGVEEAAILSAEFVRRQR